MRLLVYAALLFLIALPASAMDCHSKDEVIKALPPDVQSLKISGDDAVRFREFANGLYAANEEPDGEGFTYVLTWSESTSAAIWIIFDEHNCFYGHAQIEKSRVAQWIGAAS